MGLKVLKTKLRYLLSLRRQTFNLLVFMKVKQDYSEIKKEALELGQLQREMALAFQQQLLSTVQKLQGLTDNQSLSKNSTEATDAAIESLVEQSNVAENLTNKLKKL
uniref:Uncharacterized protein n=1 Tax=Ciona intestinalis TaxID=7719 RepID=H2XN71_CIOIN